MKILKKICKISALSITGAALVTAGVVFGGSMSDTKASESIVSGQILENEDIIELEDFVVEDRVIVVSDEQTVQYVVNPVKPIVMDEEDATENEAVVETTETEEATEETEVTVEDDAQNVEVAADETEVAQTDAEPVYTDPVAGVALTDAQGVVVATQNTARYSVLANEVYKLINEYRVANGVDAIAFDSSLTQVAMHRSAENAWVECFTTANIDGKFHHVRPNGEKASTVFTVYGMSGAYAENMGRYQLTPYEIVLGEYGWKNSATHNALMLSTAYTRVGVGVAQDSEGYYYWTAVFSN